MAMAVSSNEGKSYSDINMTPLIDVMLVLLIIFIITIPSQTHAVKIDNPSHNQPPPNTRPEVIDFVAETLADLQHRGLKKIGFVNNELF
jgi:biopolymer transport protein ExbD